MDTRAPKLVQLRSFRGNLQESTEWSSDHVRFESNDSKDKEFPSISVSWSGRPFDETLRAMLLHLHSEKRSAAQGYRYELHVEFDHPPSVELTWNVESENQDLRTLRQSVLLLDHLRYEESRQKLASARKAEQESNFPEAKKLLTQGIRILGVLYHSETSLDSTGQRIVAATAKERSGDIKDAVAILRGVLESRLSQYSAQYIRPSSPNSP